MQRHSQPKRILMILENGSFPQDTRVYLEAVALCEAGYHTSVICPTGKSRLKYELVEGVHVYRYPCPPEFNGVLGYLFEYSYSLVMAFIVSCWVLFRNGFDAIHVHCPPDLNSMLAIFFKMFGKKFVVDLHDLSPELFQAQKNGNANRLLIKGLHFFERLASRNADRLIATNQSQNAIQIRRCGADPRRCYVVRNGPNELFNPDIQPLDEFRIPGKVIIGYVGLMGFQDGVDYLIRALAKVRLIEDNFFAVIVGRGPALESLKKLTEELGLNEHVLFTGYVEFEKVPRYIASFDICATPDPSNSYNDSCTTIKTMEYMAIGRPTVAFRTRENEITAGDAGFYAENNSEDEFAEFIVKLARDPELRHRMGRIGRERIVRSLDWSHQRKVLVRLYDDLFAGRFNDESLTIDRDPPASSNTVGLQSRFCFNGKIQEFLSRSLAKDIANARLSTSFRLYYQIRPLMPTGIRKLCQSSRNRNLPSDRQWYIPHALANHLESQPEPVQSPWPEKADVALLLTHDVETQYGFSLISQLAEIEESLGFRSSWSLVPYKYKIDQGLVDSLRGNGHEIAIHGYNHDGRLFQSKRMFDSRVPMINQAIERYDAVGFRAPMVHRNLAWMQQLNIEYDASCFDVDPYQAMPGGVQGIWPFVVGKFVELPYTMPQDHTLFVSLGETTDRVWREKLRFIQQHHGMALMLTHPDYLDSPSRLAIYRDFLVWLRDHSNHWHVLPREMATWFRKRQQN